MTEDKNDSGQNDLRQNYAIEEKKRTEDIMTEIIITVDKEDVSKMLVNKINAEKIT